MSYSNAFKMIEDRLRERDGWVKNGHKYCPHSCDFFHPSRGVGLSIVPNDQMAIDSGDLHPAGTIVIHGEEAALLFIRMIAVAAGHRHSP